METFQRSFPQDPGNFCTPFCKSKSPHYISTVCKKGYRFKAEVTAKEHYEIAKASEANPLHYRPQALAYPVCHEHTRELAKLVQAF